MSQRRGMVCIIPDAFSARILGGPFVIFTARISSDGFACNTVLGSLRIQLVHCLCSLDKQTWQQVSFLSSHDMNRW